MDCWITTLKNHKLPVATGLRRAAEHNPQVKTILQRPIETADRQIDGLVYELYGLTNDEIAIVEGL